MGSGTTLIEAKLLNRNAIGVDINPHAIELTKNNLEFEVHNNPRIEIRKASATDLYFIKDNSIDLICTHPPYANIIHYSKDKQDIDQFKEEKYAERQRNEWEEIYEYMQLIVANNGREKDLGDDNVIKVPTSEAAAYLEWILWRSFLAIDHTVNKPYEARGFNIDQDYMPVGTAPGGMPDMFFEFEDYVIVVEVTMSTNSRQEAMEGEPVRRHVADYVERYNKPVYGIFVANKIDSNTAETFRIGVWYNKNDEKMALKIVPYTLKDYAEYFRNIFRKNIAKPESVITLFEECFKAKEGREAPSWKQEISNIVLSRCSE